MRQACLACVSEELLGYPIERRCLVWDVEPYSFPAEKTMIPTGICAVTS